MTRRQDARRNRELLLEAGEQVFREQGVQVPLQLVAECAGVGRGTLYRHFPDRDHLIRAMAERLVERIETRLASDAAPAHSVEALFSWIADTLCTVPGLGPYLASTEEGRTINAHLYRRVRTAFADTVEVAQAQNHLRPGVTLDDFVDGWVMILGGVLTAPPRDRERLVARAKALLGSALFVAGHSITAPIGSPAPVQTRPSGSGRRI